MRQMRPLLIATTNQSKQTEMLHVLGDLPFDFLTVNDLPVQLEAPDESKDSIEENAIVKAIYYGKNSGFLTIADDTGLFIEQLNGWPGVMSARIAPDGKEANNLVLEKMKNIPEPGRTAAFRASLVVYDPTSASLFACSGETRGRILDSWSGNFGKGFGYDPIFYADEAGKPYSEFTLEERYQISHRGKALFKMKYILQRQYGGEHIVVPIALIVKDKKVLMARRNDPHRPQFHKKWEFSGGRMDIGETLEENLLREVREEIGYDVSIVKRLNYIGLNYQKGEAWSYQVYLMPFVCRVTGGTGKHRDAEVIETAWFDPDDVLRQDLMENNGSIYQGFLPELREIIKEKKL